MENLKSRVTKGFTLIEILIALFVFAIFGVITASIINNMAMSKQTAQQNLAELEAFQFTSAIIRQDFAQIIDRGQNIHHSKNAVVGTQNELYFTRGGNINPNASSRRSTLSRIHYYLKNGELCRDLSFTLDTTSTANIKLTKACFLHDLTSLTFTYTKDNLHHQPIWDEIKLPYAIEMDLEHKILGKMSFFFPLPQSLMIKKEFHNEK